MDIKSFKELFDPKLNTYIQQKMNQAKQLLDNPEINTYIDYLETFVFSGGKRIRPYCLWLMYKGFDGQDDEDILQFAIVFELLHTMALIHDDIIDQSQKRHNVSTMHAYIGEQLGESHNIQVSEGQAILIGDLLLSRVYELGNKHYRFSEQLLEDARINLHTMIEEVILGQMIDVQMMTGKNTTKEMIEKKNMFKTASYTFTRPLLTGAILAGADTAQKDLVIKLGNALGVAFQIKDDLMDITLGDKTKSLFSDIQEGQQTYFTQYIKEHGSQSDNELLSSCMGQRLNNEQITSLQKVCKESGAIEAGISRMFEYTKKAKELLNAISFKNTLAYDGIIGLILKIEQL
ncbi:MAG: polyprenyl synthetase family protein [Candidatus Absconditabacteria bacterium]